MGQCDTFLGTARYMAPETLGGKKYSFPADIWSLGICLYEFAVGRYPYANFASHWELLDAMQAQPAPSLPAGDEYSEAFRDFVSKCLQLDPDARAQVQELQAHPFVNGTLTSIVKEQTITWLAEQLDRYTTSKPKNGGGGSGGGGGGGGDDDDGGGGGLSAQEQASISKLVAKTRGMDLSLSAEAPLEEDYEAEEFEEYAPSPSNSTSPVRCCFRKPQSSHDSLLHC